MQFLRIATVASFFLFSPSLQAALNVDIQSTSALLINPATGKVLFAKNATQTMYPASCTKIAFALYAIKYHKKLFNTVITCSHNSLKSLTEAQKSRNNFAEAASYILETDSSHMGLKVGEEMRFYDLLEATMVISADDASNVIAEVMGNGSIEKCVEEVNRFVASLGCKNTHFTNPHGLPHPNHVSTAEDLAILCREAMKEPLFREMAKKASYVRPETNKQASVPLQPTNRLLVKNSPHYYPNAVGVKTGYHRRAGCCLVAQAEKDNRSLISVVLQAKSNADRFQETKKLFEAAFQETPLRQTVLKAGPQSCSLKIKGSKQELTTFTQEPVTLSYYPSEKPEMRCRVNWDKISLPVKKGAVVGEIVLYADGKPVKKAKLYAHTQVKADFIHALKQQRVFILLTLAGCAVLGVIMYFRRQMKAS